MARSPLGPLPPDAHIAGKNVDGTLLYIGRAWHELNLIPGKVLSSQHDMYVSHDNKEYDKKQYEILCGGNLSWTKVNSSDIFPPNALRGGQTRTGERLYIGRVDHQGCLTPGKVQFAPNRLLIPFDGLEIRYDSFELLIEN